MAYCKKCGAEISETAKFCPKCGVEEPTKPEEVTVSADKEPEEQAKTDAYKFNIPKQIDVNWIDKHFIIVYVILGVLAYLLLNLASAYVGISLILGILLNVLAILFAAAFCVVGFIPYFKNGSDKGKHSTRNILCMALGIIIAIYIFLVGIVNFIYW